jgi:hypothetical protein
MPDKAAQVSGDIERVTTNSSVAVISTRCRSVSQAASGALEDLGLKFRPDATGAGQAAVLL